MKAGEKFGTGSKDTSKKFYKKWWFWAIVAVLVVIGIASPNDTAQQSTAPATKETTTPASPAAPKEAEPNVPTEYKSALAQAKSYSDTMHMSKAGLYDQLVSPYGGKFTPEAAQYAIDNVKADWNANALAQAKNYQKTMNMSPAAVRDQLVSEYGGKFTEAEADYAVQNLN